MNTILEQFKDKINGSFSFFDRMIIIKGHIRLFFSDSGRGYFLSEMNVLLKDFPAYAETVTKNIVSHIEDLAASHNRPLIYLASANTSKEGEAVKIMETSPVEEGLICILSVVEYCQTLQPKKQADGKLRLTTASRKCKYYYLYFQDKEFGFMHVKLQTWFPFAIQVYVNGREMMKHVFDQNNISYKMYENSFFDISDIPKAQELADKFDSKKLCRQLDLFAHSINPYLDTIEKVFHQGYYWCVDQCEYATDIMFKSRKALEDIYPSLVDHAFYGFKCTDVFSFMGRKLDPRFQGEAVSDYRKRPIGWRIKFKMNANSIKMYDKYSSLRVEMTINNPREFKVFKDVRHRDGTVSKRWVPMGKSIANLYRYAEISAAANRRFLDAIQNIVPVKKMEKEISDVCKRKTVDGKTVTGFNVWEPDTFLLLETIADGRYLLKGFTNHDICGVLYPKTNTEVKYRSKTGRQLKKLRQHGLIKKFHIREDTF